MLLPIYSYKFKLRAQVQIHKHASKTHSQVHLTREDHSQLLHANVTHSRVSRKWDVASGRYRSPQVSTQLQLQTV